MTTEQNKQDKVTNTDEKKPQKTSRPNEVGGFYFSSHLKITDPETGEVLVQARGD
jgi:hypothetical protein